MKKVGSSTPMLFKGQVHLVCSVDQISEHQAVLSADRVQQKGT